MGFISHEAPNNWIVYDRININNISPVLSIPLQQPNHLLWRKISLLNCSYPVFLYKYQSGDKLF